MFKCPECGTKKRGDHCFHNYGKYRVGYYLGHKRKSTYIQEIDKPRQMMIEGIKKLNEARIDAMFLLR